MGYQYHPDDMHIFRAAAHFRSLLKGYRHPFEVSE
jgi:hypothetical protein